MQDKLKCAIYTRVSTDMQAEKEFNSCEAQEAWFDRLTIYPNRISFDKLRTSFQDVA